MTRHYSKVDWWLVFLLLLALFYAVSYLVLGLLNHNRNVPWWAVGLFLLIAGFIGLMSWPLYYDISEGLLTIRMGIVRWRVPRQHPDRGAKPSRMEGTGLIFGSDPDSLSEERDERECSDLSDRQGGVPE